MKITYWASTIIIALFLLWSAYTYLFQKAVIDGVRELGFPDFFRIQLAALKIIAVVLLLLPNAPLYAKEWAYAGVGLFLLTALVAHIAHKDSVGISMLLVLLFVVLIVSRVYLQKTAMV
ncbi:DoxX family protein [Allomuricauda sp. d1]|uniref:DoxX family protein n=1 Tax=Allomuricauda sp. d1 TaxID=3136725 RepID=UPI0031D7C187